MAKPFKAFRKFNYEMNCMQSKALVIGDLLAAALVGIVFAAVGQYNLAIFLSAFTALAFGAALSHITRKKSISRWYQNEESKSLKLFEEKLSKERVIELTQSIAKGKRFLGGTDKIDEISSFIESDARVVRTQGRVYVIQRAAFAEILDMLPMNDEKMALLTETQRRILRIASSAGVVLHKDGEWSMKDNGTNGLTS